jgi:hypothetical protein
VIAYEDDKAAKVAAIGSGFRAGWRD